MKRYTASNARNHLGEIIDKACSTGQPVIVERHNKPLVAIVPLATTEQSSEQTPQPFPTYHLGTVRGTLSRDELYGEDGR